MTTIPKTIHWWYGFVFFAAVVGVQVVLLNLIILAMLQFGVFGELSSIDTTFLYRPGPVAFQVLFTCTMLTVFSVFIPRAFNFPAVKWLRLNPTRPALFALAALGIVGVGFLGDQALYLLHSILPGCTRNLSQRHDKRCKSMQLIDG